MEVELEQKEAKPFDSRGVPDLPVRGRANKAGRPAGKRIALANAAADGGTVSDEYPEY